ncbi:MAG: hemolysin family protein [Gemmatimonadales bacterium]|nr:hemolysin family protein [Gemmatimonadales bacterium]
MIWLAVAIGLVLTVLGATASAALITVSRANLADAVSRRLRGASESLDWLVSAERELAAATATTGLGIAVLAAGLSAVVDAITGALPLWGVLALLLLVALPFVLISGYVLPRWLTAHRASRVAERLRPLIRPWARVISLFLPEPARRPVADVRTLWRQGSPGAMGSDELAMVGSVITFAQRPIREVMTPRTKLVAIPEGAALDEIQAAFIQSGYSRLPVYRGTVDEIVGMVHVFDLLKTAAESVPVRPVGVAPGSRSCGDVLLDMQRERRHLTVVLDEFGGTLGIVTLEDLLEAMVGEIFEEHDETAERRIPDLTLPWETSGSAEVTDLEARFGVTLPSGTSRSLGGRLVELLGRFPRLGERLQIGRLEFDVLSATPTRVERLVVRRIGPPPVVLDREVA